MKKIVSIIGARPQFIKHASLHLELQKRFKAITIHTAQHYDKNMSDVFFEELFIPKPDYILSNNKKSLHGEQTAEMLVEIEKKLIEINPDFILVYGDTNSTLASVLAAVKLNIKIIHIEAGLRSFNREMPEEINRIITDQFSSLLFCPNEQSRINLIKEGVLDTNIYISGDVMFDTLKMVEDKLTKKIDYRYYFATIHRPYNSDIEIRMKEILYQLNDLNFKVIFSIHPRSKKKLIEYGLILEEFKNISFLDPLGYIDNLSYLKYAEAIITDSGGMQKEAYWLRKKCVTIRKETEWNETLNNNWNSLLYDRLDLLQEKLNLKVGKYIPLYTSNNSSKSIAEVIFNNR
jgi:UDP-N-acetylglucosamine 2-epimerase